MKFEDLILDYKCDAETNNAIHKYFTDMTMSHQLLMKHRSYIEENNLGFGDRAFHYMWFLLLEHLFERNNTLRLLEIGVYKGQVISLWNLIGRELKRECYVSGITPLSGYIAPENRFLFYLKFITSRRFRSYLKSGYLYDNEN